MDADSSTRRRLAVSIVIASIVGAILISTVAIVLADKGTRGQTAQLVFSSVLPLLGTWVGTVLAFYFARENLQAATESTLRLTGRQTSTLVTAVMIRQADFVSYDLSSGEQLADVRLSDVRDRMQARGFHRLPLRDAQRAVLLVIHDSTLADFAESVNQTTATLDKTVGDLLNVPKYKELVGAIGFVAEKAAVDEARALMASIMKCNDIFVTPNGKPDEAATGWLTNTLLASLR